jgi:hypothetical protein
LPDHLQGLSQNDKDKLIAELKLKLNQANAKADLLKVEVDHFRRELEKEQHRGSDLDNLPPFVSSGNPQDDIKRLRLENDHLRGELKIARSDFELLKMEEQKVRDEVRKLKPLTKNSEGLVLADRLEVEAQKYNLEKDKLQFEILKLTEEKKRTVAELQLKTTEFDKIKLEADKIKAEADQIKANMDKINKENDLKILQIKTESEKNLLEAERQKIEALANKRRLDELYPKLEEMTRNQGYLQRHVTELEAQNQNLSMRLSIADQQYRGQANRQSIMSSNNQYPMMGSVFGDIGGGGGMFDTLRSNNRVLQV